MPAIEVYRLDPAPPRSPAIALPDCEGCASALLAAIADAVGRETHCAACDAWFSFTPPAPPPRRRRASPLAVVDGGAAVVRKSGPENTAVPRFVAQLLAWNASVELVERAAKGVVSSTLTAIEAYRIGIVGSGCKGSKGAGRRQQPTIEVRSADPLGTLRYQALPREHRQTADAVISDGQGYREVELTFHRWTHKLTLEHRVGFRLAPLDQVRDWSEHLNAGDSRGALAGMLELGDAALKDAARAWESERL